MKLSTHVPVEAGQPKIDYDSRVVLLGSCFVENIGEKLEHSKIRNRINPFGILFHPAAISNFLQRVRFEKLYQKEEVFHYQDSWHCFDAHSSLNATTREGLLEVLNSRLKEASEAIKEASHIILTFGTSWGYIEKGLSRVVANCHKLPPSRFEKKFLPVRKDLVTCIQSIREMNPSATILLTVSPVRHLRDGFIENQRSKSRLILAVHELLEQEKNLHYFPSYEIMMDELRDYRFYADDMVHPSKLAIELIWERLVHAWCSEQTRRMMDEVIAIRKRLSHRPFNKSSKEFREFQASTRAKIQDLQNRFPWMQFSEEI